MGKKKPKQAKVEVSVTPRLFDEFPWFAWGARPTT